MQSLPIILASASPRRKQLLEMINLDFKIVKSNVDEDFTLNILPNDFVQKYAKEKALSVANQFTNHLIIGADTIVVLDGIILGKPADEEESYTMLKKISGHTHTVLTGVSLQYFDGAIDETFFVQTSVTVMDIKESDILYYIETYNPLDKAGSYGIQDWFSVYIEKIDGCFYNVMGFPLSVFYTHYKNIITP